MFTIDCQKIIRIYCCHFVYIICMQVVIFNSLGGFLSDRFGRKRILLMMAAVHTLMSFLTALVGGKSYTYFVAIRYCTQIAYCEIKKH